MKMTFLRVIYESFCRKLMRGKKNPQSFPSTNLTFKSQINHVTDITLRLTECFNDHTSPTKLWGLCVNSSAELSRARAQCIY